MILVYLDNAATTQKPKRVLEAVNHYYLQDNANVHRGVHTLAERATAAYEAAREKQKIYQCFINYEVLYKRDNDWTQSAAPLCRRSPKGRNEVLISTYHHPNIIPWQQGKKTGSKLVYVYLKDGLLICRDLKIS